MFSRLSHFHELISERVDGNPSQMHDDERGAKTFRKIDRLEAQFNRSLAFCFAMG